MSSNILLIREFLYEQNKHSISQTPLQLEIITFSWQACVHDDYQYVHRRAMTLDGRVTG